VREGKALDCILFNRVSATGQRFVVTEEEEGGEEGREEEEEEQKA
jgi:hypothetical protein